MPWLMQEQGLEDIALVILMYYLVMAWLNKVNYISSFNFSVIGGWFGV